MTPHDLTMTIYTIEQQAYDGEWHVRTTYEDKERAEKELLLLNSLLVRCQPHATYRLVTHS